LPQTELILNGRRIKPGYIVIKRTGTPSFIQLLNDPDLEGQVHGAIYKSVFETAIPDNMVGEGFSIRDDEIGFNSVTFNARKTSYHDGAREMSILTSKYLTQFLKMKWMEGADVPININISDLQTIQLVTNRPYYKNCDCIHTNI